MAKATTTDTTPGFTFEDAERPATTRAAKPNPFTDLAAILAGNLEATKRFTVSLPADDAERKTAFDAVKRQIQTAGRGAGVTIRVVAEHGGSKAAPTATLTVWAVPQITKGSKGDDAGEPSSAPE